MKINTFNLQFFAEEVPETVDTPVESTEQSADETDVESQTTDDEEATPDYSDMLSAINGKAVYKGEPMNIESFDDVINAVQMKENYQPTHDRMTAAEARVKELENSRQAKYMKQFLTENGYDTFGDWEDALEVSKLVEGGMSEELAKQHMAGQKALNAKEEARIKAEKEANKEDLTSKKSVEAIDWFKNNGYGELTADKITQETWDKVNNDDVPLKYALMEQMFSTVKGDVQQETLKKLQNKKENSQVAVDSKNSKQSKTVWDMSDAEFAKDKERRKRGY